MRLVHEVRGTDGEAERALRVVLAAAARLEADPERVDESVRLAAAASLEGEAAGDRAGVEDGDVVGAVVLDRDGDAAAGGGRRQLLPGRRERLGDLGPDGDLLGAIPVPAALVVGDVLVQGLAGRVEVAVLVLVDAAGVLPRVTAAVGTAGGLRQRVRRTCVRPRQIGDPGVQITQLRDGGAGLSAVDVLLGVLHGRVHGGYDLGRGPGVRERVQQVAEVRDPVRPAACQTGRAALVQGGGEPLVGPLGQRAELLLRHGAGHRAQVLERLDGVAVLLVAVGRADGGVVGPQAVGHPVGGAGAGVVDREVPVGLQGRLVVAPGGGEPVPAGRRHQMVGLLEAVEERLLHGFLVRVVVPHRADGRNGEQQHTEQEGERRPARPGEPRAQCGERTVDGGQQHEQDVHGERGPGDAVGVGGQGDEQQDDGRRAAGGGQDPSSDECVTEAETAQVEHRDRGRSPAVRGRGWRRGRHRRHGECLVRAVLVCGHGGLPPSTAPVSLRIGSVRPGARCRQRGSRTTSRPWTKGRGEPRVRR